MVLALLLSTLSVLSISTVAASSVQRDTDSTPGASVPTTGIKLSMYRGFALGSCSITDPNVAPGPTTFPANTAFFLRHGWLGFNQKGQDNGAFWGANTDFELYIDGVYQNSLPDFSSSSGNFVKLFVFNHGDGMTGTHVFVGWWFIDDGLLGGTYGVKDFALGCALRVNFV